MSKLSPDADMMRQYAALRQKEEELERKTRHGGKDAIITDIHAGRYCPCGTQLLSEALYCSEECRDHDRNRQETEAESRGEILPLTVTLAVDPTWIDYYRCQVVKLPSGEIKLFASYDDAKRYVNT
jgi:predicted nucleic acid-binding Zn ribbon protein